MREMDSNGTGSCFRRNDSKNRIIQKSRVDNYCVDIQKCSVIIQLICTNHCYYHLLALIIYLSYIVVLWMQFSKYRK